MNASMYMPHLHDILKISFIIRYSFITTHYLGKNAQMDYVLFRYASDSETGEQPVLESMKDYIINTIQRTFEVGCEQAECLYTELLQCTRKKNLVRINIINLLLFDFICLAVHFHKRSSSST